MIWLSYPVLEISWLRVWESLSHVKYEIKLCIYKKEGLNFSIQSVAAVWYGGISHTRKHFQYVWWDLWFISTLWFCINMHIYTCSRLHIVYCEFQKTQTAMNISLPNDFFFRVFFFFFSFSRQGFSVALEICLPLPPTCWGWRQVPPPPTTAWLIIPHS